MICFNGGQIRNVSKQRSALQKIARASWATALLIGAMPLAAQPQAVAAEKIATKSATPLHVGD